MGAMLLYFDFAWFRLGKKLDIEEKSLPNEMDKVCVTLISTHSQETPTKLVLKIMPWRS